MKSASPAGEPGGTLVDADRGVESPILLTVFNRLETVRQVLAVIREARPARLYVAADGPRPGKPKDAEQIREVCDYVVANVDWDCELSTNFRTDNLGCRKAISGAITWFFENEEEGIILEDDCLPDPTFFGYCDELLDRYRDDDEVMHISGTCLIEIEDPDASYFFSGYPLIWGWATWRKAWAGYALDAPELDQEMAGVLDNFATQEERDYWDRVLRWYFDGNIDTWDYPWAYTIWKAKGKSIYPTRSIVKNIGFGKGSTHTKSWKDDAGISDRPLETMPSISHPESERVNQALDHRVFLESYLHPPLFKRAFKLLRRALSR